MSMSHVPCALSPAQSAVRNRALRHKSPTSRRSARQHCTTVVCALSPIKTNMNASHVSVFLDTQRRETTVFRVDTGHSRGGGARARVSQKSKDATTDSNFKTQETAYSPRSHDALTDSHAHTVTQHTPVTTASAAHRRGALSRSDTHCVSESSERPPRLVRVCAPTESRVQL
jgi:hypothetical protein